MKDYAEFLESKRVRVEACGFDVPMENLNPKLFDWQRAVVRWSIHRGRASLFEDCGLGKTIQELEWGHQIIKHENCKGLILTPLAVAQQFVEEGQKFGIEVTHCRTGADVKPGLNVTNYERLHHFEPNDFGALIADEASILKSFDGVTRKKIQAFAERIKYRLGGTATPAPNDLIELTNHAEFMDVMTGKEIIALFFKQDGNTTHQWRLKGHAKEAFWKWMAEWSVAMRKPSDLGYDDGGFILPPLNMHSVVVDGKPSDGYLFAMEAQTLMERRGARRASLSDRVELTAKLVNESQDRWLVWCNLNSESEALTKAIPGAMEVKGADDSDYKEETLTQFARGNLRVLVSKPSIAGMGLNLQVCNKMAFVGLSDSYEEFYQAVRRCWRFGQTKAVDCYVVTATTEGAVVTNIRRKEKQASEMFDEIVKHMKVHELNRQTEKSEAVYQTAESKGEGWRLMLGDSCERVKEIDSDSIGLTVFSPPFPGMYAYTNSPRDVGNVKSFDQLIKHFSFLMDDLLRVTEPGRCCCIHLTQEPVFKGKDGFVGLRDFRGDVIREMQNHGWQYFSEVTIDKNPMLKASRTKEATLLFKTLSKDSSQSRPALADYLLVFRKPGQNGKFVKAGRHQRWNKDGGWITPDEWCEWAAPVWYRAMPKEKSPHQPWQGNYPSRHQDSDGISETDVLQFRSAKEHDDEKHLCPLQLGVIERCVKLWSAPGDLVLSPFAGIGSEGVVSLRLGRKFVGIELKRSYYEVACQNLKQAESESKETELI